jgi:quercetin dioxygenase-like cupin family protein
VHKVNVNSVPDKQVKDDGAAGTRIKWLINESDGAPTFLMRQFTLEAGGHTPFHDHDWEHEVYILEGAGTVMYEGKEEAIGPGDAILIPPKKKHQFRAGADRELKFLCMVPK